jgi:hypothetical protein
MAQASRQRNPRYGDPGAPQTEFCRPCYGEHYRWDGYDWYVIHGPREDGRCDCQCHEGEIAMAASGAIHRA